MASDNPGSDGSKPFESAGEKNPFRDNPYASPELQRGQAASMSGEPLPPARNPGMVRHVPVVAILLIVQGVLEIPMGMMLVAIAGFLPTLLQMEGMNQQPPGMSPEEFPAVILFFYAGLGVLTLIAAGLHIIAGIRNYRFRGRLLGIVALIGGMVTMFTCYCAPTAIGLSIYGLITYFNPETSQAFAMGEMGTKRDDILTTFQ